MKRLLLPALLLIFSVPTFAREVYLGSAKLSRGNNADTLIVASCRNAMNDGRDWDRDERPPGRWDRNDGRYQALRFTVTKARAHVDRIDIVYGNGQRESFFPRDRNFMRDESSRWFNFAGQDRCIYSLTVYGGTDSRGIIGLFKKARVNFYGQE